MRDRMRLSNRKLAIGIVLVLDKAARAVSHASEHVTVILRRIYTKVAHTSVVSIVPIKQSQ